MAKREKEEQDIDIWNYIAGKVELFLLIKAKTRKQERLHNAPM